MIHLQKLWFSHFFRLRDHFENNYRSTFRHLCHCRIHLSVFRLLFLLQIPAHLPSDLPDFSDSHPHLPILSHWYTLPDCPDSVSWRLHWSYHPSWSRADKRSAGQWHPITADTVQTEIPFSDWSWHIPPESLRIPEVQFQNLLHSYKDSGNAVCNHWYLHSHRHLHQPQWLFHLLRLPRTLRRLHSNRLHSNLHKSHCLHSRSHPETHPKDHYPSVPEAFLRYR